MQRTSRIVEQTRTKKRAACDSFSSARSRGARDEVIEVAAKLAYPERQSIAFVGDGGFTMLMGEFATAVKYGLPVVVVVIKNNTLGQIKWEQLVFLGNPEYGCELQPIDFAKFAEACGGVGITVERPEDLRPALERAIASDRPALPRKKARPV